MEKPKEVRLAWDLCMRTAIRKAARNVSISQYQRSSAMPINYKYSHGSWKEDLSGQVLCSSFTFIVVPDRSLPRVSFPLGHLPI
jgi:hypothetical protein